MGNSSSTTVIVQQNESPPANKPKPPPNFMQSFISEINLVLSPPITYTGDAQKDTKNLFQQVNTLANNKFTLAWNYPYQGINSVPPLATDQATVFGVSDVVSVPTNNPALITAYINNNVIPNTTLPDDVQLKAASKLYQNVATLLQNGETNAWLNQNFHQKFTAKDKTNWILEGTFVYAVAQAIDYSSSGNAQDILFLQYLGTTYQV